MRAAGRSASVAPRRRALPSGARGGGSGPFENFPGRAAGAEELRSGGRPTDAAAAGGGTKGWARRVGFSAAAAAGRGLTSFA